MSYYIGIDLGTSYFKAGVFDKNGQLRGLGRKYVHKTTDSVICELSVSVFWRTLADCIDEAITAAGIRPDGIRAVSYASQANSFILLDEQDEPLTNLILWPDKRAQGIEMPVPDDFLKKTGLGITPNHEFIIAKIRWFQKHHPIVWKQTANILSISDYLVFKLTGHKVCDYGTASMTGLFDQTKTGWWKSQLKRFHLDEKQLPIPKRSGTVIDTLIAEGAKLTGLPSHALFCLGGLDHHIAAVGAGITLNRNISESTGTVLACVDYSEGYTPEPEICVIPGLEENYYFRMIFDNNGAIALEWYQKHYAPECALSQLLEEAAAVDPGCDGLTALPCANTYPGLSGFVRTQEIAYTHGHYVRALLESIARSLHTLVKKMGKTVPYPVIVPTGGGGRSELLIQIKAKCLDTTFRVPVCTESACMGAALIAAAGTENDCTINELVNMWVKYK